MTTTTTTPTTQRQTGAQPEEPSMVTLTRQLAAIARELPLPSSLSPMLAIRVSESLEALAWTTPEDFEIQIRALRTLSDRGERLAQETVLMFHRADAV